MLKEDAILAEFIMSLKFLEPRGRKRKLPETDLIRMEDVLETEGFDFRAVGWAQLTSTLLRYLSRFLLYCSTANERTRLEALYCLSKALFDLENASSQSRILLDLRLILDQAVKEGTVQR